MDGSNLKAGQEGVVYLDGDGDVHGRGVRVVAALRLVDVVVGVDRLLGAELPAHDFDGPGILEIE